jgi:DNA polymerase-1
VKVETPLGRSPERSASSTPAKLIAFLKAMEFTTITKRVGEPMRSMSGVEADPIAPGGARARRAQAPLYAETAAGRGRGGAGDADDCGRRQSVDGARSRGDGWLQPADLAAARKRRGDCAVKIDHASYECVVRLLDLARWIGWAYEAGFVALDTETNSLDPMQADLIGISLASRRARPAISRCSTAPATTCSAGLLEGQIPIARRWPS